MEEMRQLMQSLFRDYESPHHGSERVEGIVRHVRAGTLARDTFGEVFGQGDEPTRAERDQLLDVVLYGVLAVLGDHTVTREEEALLTYMLRVFRVEEGDFHARRRTEVAELLQIELRRTLIDGEVDAREDGQLSRTQGILGLGYDQYLELTQDVITQVVDDWIRVVDAGGDTRSTARGEIDRKLALLRTVYPLLPRQRRALGLDPA